MMDFIYCLEPFVNGRFNLYDNDIIDETDDLRPYITLIYLTPSELMMILTKI